MNTVLECGGFVLAEAVRQLYSQGQTDYSLEPLVLADRQGCPIGRIQDGDAVIFCCRRGEREVELTEAFVERDFPYFPRPQFHNLTFVIFTLYHEKFKDLPVAFALTCIPDTLGEVVSRAGLRQLRTAESEKFAHVTFFFNGGSHQPLAGEDDWCIPSPKGIRPDLEPSLSLPEVTQKIRLGIENKFDLIVANFANGDVIGHTANDAAKLRCAEIIDQQLGEVVRAAIPADYVLLVTADHGNLEELTHADGTPHVAHTTNPVPLVFIDPRAPAAANLRAGGALADLAPTILEALGVPQPKQMDGASLAPGYAWQGRRRVLLLILDGWGIGKADANNPI
jgi:2,3-bisphosphoglycerate-independent phosphoglycerate mutase